MKTRHQTGKGGKLARTLVEFHIQHLGQQLGRCRVPDAGNRDQQVTLLLQCRMLINVLADQSSGAFDFLGEVSFSARSQTL